MYFFQLSNLTQLSRTVCCSRQQKKIQFNLISVGLNVFVFGMLPTHLIPHQLFLAYILFYNLTETHKSFTLLLFFLFLFLPLTQT